MAQRLTKNVGVAPLLLAAAFLLPCPAPGAATVGGIGPLCPAQWLLHLSCPGCGMTRSVVATAHGQLLSAFAFHPLGPVIFVWIVVAALCRVPGVRQTLPRISSRTEDAVAAVFVLATLGVWILRLLHLLPGPTT